MKNLVVWQKRSSSLLRSLEQREFRWFWLGQIISQMGDQVFRITLVWTVLRVTDSPLALGNLLAVYSVAFGISLIPAGLAADRWPRRSLMIISDVGRALLMICFTLLLSKDSLHYGYLLVGAILFGILDALFQPASKALIPQVMAKHNLTSANSLFEIGLRLTSALGPAFGGWLIALLGVPIAFLFNGGSFLISALTIQLMGHIETYQGSGSPHQTAQEHSSDESERAIRPVIQYLRQTSWLWVTIVIAAVSNGFTQAPLFALLPFFVERILDSGPHALGVLWSGAALGAILVAGFLGQTARAQSRLVWGYIGLIISGLAISALSFPFASQTPVAFVLMVVSGSGLALFGLMWSYLLQDRVPQRALGRIFSLDMAGSSILVPAGYMLAGALATIWSLPLLLLVSGSLTVILSLTAISLTSIRLVD
ncbi:MFS transporter [Candidatus Acetothermia bacterium]|nr:MFS transporter [Candidatus Acetothermia bacterium]